MAANAGIKLRHKTKLQSWKKRFMGVSPEGGQKAWAMVQDLLIQTYVYLHADPFINACAFAAVPDLSLPDAFRIFTHRFALRTSVFQKSCADAQVFADEAFRRS
jgi:hypothetical protein